ncbi:MAG: outer membrane beta-barrel protein [Prolixibacteraceae bacterium]|nr:outer membrane beta-barrel protein [Prolixibacteraceae bacterium]
MNKYNLKRLFFYSVLLIALLFISTNNSYAYSPFRNPKFYVDARLGLGWSNIKGDFNTYTKMQGNSKLSLVALYRLKTNLMLESSIGISSFANKYKGNDLKAYKARYFQLPLLIRYKFYKVYSLGIGATNHFLIGAKQYGIGEDFDDVNINDKMRKYLPSATINLQIGDQGLYLGCIYDYALNNLRSDARAWDASSFRIYLQMNISELIIQSRSNN